MQRYPYDLSHFSLVTGKIGRLMGVTTIPVVAGDSFEAQITSVINQSPLRRQLTIDARFDIFGFYIPYRHVYGDDWTDFIEQGYDESVTFSGDNVTEPCYYYGVGDRVSGTTPKWLTAGYNRIWNRWFRVPNVTTTELADTYFPTGGDDENRYGYKTAMLPSYLTPSQDVPDSTDYEYTLTASNLSLIDLQQLKARYKTEIDRHWFTQRYSEIIERNFSKRLINPDAEQRPELCYRKSVWMSGHDVSGTDEGLLGANVGRSQGVLQVNMPRKHFPEHGTFWVLCTMRYPTICNEHQHFLVATSTASNPTYKQIVGDPEVIRSQPPAEYYERDFLMENSSGTSMGYFPYAWWYRTHPSVVHTDLKDLKGFPFLEHDNLVTDNTYVTSSDYDKAFSNLSQGHYQVYSKVSIGAQRVVPPAISSVYAGV